MFGRLRSVCMAVDVCTALCSSLAAADLSHLKPFGGITEDLKLRSTRERDTEPELPGSLMCRSVCLPRTDPRHLGERAELGGYGAALKAAETRRGSRAETVAVGRYRGLSR